MHHHHHLSCFARTGFVFVRSDAFSLFSTNPILLQTRYCAVNHCVCVCVYVEWKMQRVRECVAYQDDGNRSPSLDYASRSTLHMCEKNDYIYGRSLG